MGDTAFGAFNRAFKDKLRLEEKKADQQLTILLKDMEMNFRSEEADSSRQFQKDMHNASVYNEYADTDVTINPKTGFASPNDDADLSKIRSIQQNLYTQDIDYLRQYGLDDSGSAEQITARRRIHTSARNKGISFSRPSLTGDLAPYEVDVSPDMITSSDIEDTQKLILDYGYENPMVLETLVSNGIIDRNDLYQTPEGFPTLRDSKGDLDNNKLANLKIATDGFISGIRLNEEYKSNLEYENIVQERDVNALNRANVIAGAPDTVSKTAVLNDAKVALGFYLNVTMAENGERTMSFKGEQVAVSDYKEHIQKGKYYRGLSASDRKNMTDFIDILSAVSPQGAGTELLVNYLNEAPEMLKHVAQWDKALATQLANLMNAKGLIKRVVDVTNKLIKTPSTIENISQLKGLDAIVNNSGLANVMFKSREVLLAEGAGSKKYLELEDQAYQIYQNIMSQPTLSDKDKEDLLNWVEFEDASWQLKLEAAGGRLK